MNQTLRQLLGMAQAEFRLHWRRRGLLVITLSLLVLPAMSALLTRTELDAVSQSLTQTTGLAASAARESVTIAIVFGTWAAVYVVVAVLLPPIMADSIPRDQQLGVRELLDSLPLTTPTYLAGKVLGASVSVAAGLGAAMLIIGGLWLALVGPFEAGPYVQMWLLGALGMAVVNTSLAVLLAGTQPNRRRAVLVGVALSLLVLYVLTSQAQASPNTVGYILSPARPALFNYYVRGWLQAPGAAIENTTTLRHVWLTLLAGAGQVALVGAGLWAWLRWRAARSTAG